MLSNYVIAKTCDFAAVTTKGYRNWDRMHCPNSENQQLVKCSDLVISWWSVCWLERELRKSVVCVKVGGWVFPHATF